MTKNNEEKDLKNEELDVEPPKEESPKKGKKVEVDAGFLEKLMGTLESQGKEIKKLNAIADKGRLAHYNQTHKGEAPKIYRLNSYQGNIVLSWEMVANDTWRDAEGKWREKQDIELTLDGGDKVKLPYVEFVTSIQKVSAKLLATVQKGGQTIFEVEAEDGKKYVIDSTYIN